MVDEMFDSSQMEVNDGDDSILMGSSGSGSGAVGLAGAGGANGAQASGAGECDLEKYHRTVHADFHNNFGDLYDDKDLD